MSKDSEIGVLSDAHRRELVTAGFTVIHGAIHPSLVRKAKRFINQQIHKSLNGSSPLSVPQNVHSTSTKGFTDMISAAEPITELFNASQIPDILSRILHNVPQTQVVGQIALRFPGSLSVPSRTKTNILLDNPSEIDKLEERASRGESADDLILQRSRSRYADDELQPVPFWESFWHIDGLFSPNNNLIPQGEIHNFTALIGVLLNDLDDDLCGNLSVYPGDHWTIQQYFRTHGFDKVKQEGLSAFATDSLRLRSERPAQVKGKAGDIVIANYLLPHTIAPNLSPDIRYAVYFRVNCRNSSDHFQSEPMLDMFLDWKGLAPIIAAIDAIPALPDPAKISSSRFRPSYADIAVADLLNGASPSRGVISGVQATEQMKRTFELLFFSGRWNEAASVFWNLTEATYHHQEQQSLSLLELNRQVTLLIQGGICLTTKAVTESLKTTVDSPTVQIDLRKGYRCIVCALQIFSKLPGAYCGLGFNLCKQKKYAFALAVLRRSLSFPIGDYESLKEKNPADNTLPDAFKHSAEALSGKRATAAEIADFLSAVKSNFPPNYLKEKFNIDLDRFFISVRIQTLWGEGRSFICSPLKNFSRGRELFLEIASLDPTDYWAHSIAGACCNQLGLFEEAEQTLRKAVTIKPDHVNAFTLLTQNLFRQHRREEAVRLVNQMLSPETTLVNVTPTDLDACTKLVEALQVAKTVLGGNSPELQRLIQLCQLRYPFVNTTVILQTSQECLLS